MRVFLIIALLSTHVFSLFSQTTTNSFEVIYNGSSIGSLEASKIMKSPRSTINLKSNTDAKVLIISVHVESEVNLTKYKDVLFKGIGYCHANRGSKDVLTKVTKMKSHYYKMVKNGKRTNIKVSEIKYCVADLYFTEPKGITSIFSNTEGDFLPITPQENNAYKLSLPNGRSSTYYYTNGLLTHVETEITFGSITFKKKG